MSALSSLPIVAPGVMTRRVIPNIGTITYLSAPTSYFIQYISWSIALTRFYYVKLNFITFNSQGNITSVHPALYTDRNEPSFECDNGFKVVSRFVTVRGKRTKVFNFKDLSGHIICDIDFTQVKPFDEYKDMTARGYTPNRRCYMVFEDSGKHTFSGKHTMRNRMVGYSNQVPSHLPWPSAVLPIVSAYCSINPTRPVLNHTHCLHYIPKD